MCFETPWDLLHAAYFDGYALWTYVTQPFLYSYPDFVVEEIEPWQENGELWRRLKVTFPEGMAYHNRDRSHTLGPTGSCVGTIMRWTFSEVLPVLTTSTTTANSTVSWFRHVAASFHLVRITRSYRNRF